MRFLLMLAFLPAVAFGVTVGSLPVFEYADKEASTNIPFAVSIETMSRMELSLSLDASSTVVANSFKPGFVLEVR